MRPPSPPALTQCQKQDEQRTKQRQLASPWNGLFTWSQWGTPEEGEVTH